MESEFQQSQPQTELLTPDDVLELFKDQYLSIPRDEALERLRMSPSTFSDFIYGRRNIHRCKRVLELLGLEAIPTEEKFRKVNNIR